MDKKIRKQLKKLEKLDKLLAEARQTRGQALQDLHELQRQCPHDQGVTKHSGSLTHQKWIVCNRCDGVIRSGYDAFPSGQADVHHDNTGN